jgi:hypothetical protein
MPCFSWSLQALETCPGSRDPQTKQIVAACFECYARYGNYTRPNVKKIRVQNRLDWQHPDWETQMVKRLDTERYFRWFDSGDVYHPDLAQKIYNIMKRTPWCKHWLPTRSYKIERIRIILEQMKRLKNVSLRYSSDGVNGEYEAGLHGSTIIPSPDFPTKAHVCQSYANGGKCGDCRACWNKRIKVIGYVSSGIKAKARIRKEAKLAA